ncbi:MAG: beta-lactamase family protein [Thermoclostridium sp.]|nr:beta-lactamase family protein [Thermoclostridium sp.]
MNINNLVGKEFSGVISLSIDGNRIFQGAYGFADQANGIPNRIDTRFATASAGKVFVAAAILSLIEKNLIRFESSIGEILKFDLKQIDPEITVRQLLNHTSGIPDYFDESVMKDYEELWIDTPNYRIRKSSDLIPLFIDKPMMYPKGERFQYNNTGYVVLGLIIEEITGKPFDAYLQETIFDPCKMTDTGYYELDKLPARCAFSYIFDQENNDYRTNIFSVDAKGSGAGGAFTTAADVEKFWAALTGGRLISEKFIKMMLSPQVSEGCYGYGVWLINGETPSFQGCDPGVNFITSYSLDTRIIITILSNIDYDVEELHNSILSEITGHGMNG